MKFKESTVAKTVKKFEILRQINVNRIKISGITFLVIIKHKNIPLQRTSLFR